MNQVEGSNDGTRWVPFAIKSNMVEAREAAASCILKSKHTYVRIVDVKQWALSTSMTSNDTLVTLSYV